MKWSYEDRVRIDCIKDIQQELIETTNKLIKLHGNDPELDTILSAAYYGVILNLGKSINKKIPQAVFVMLGTTNLEIE